MSAEPQPSPAHPSAPPRIRVGQRLLAWFGATLLKILGRTLRVECHDDAGFYHPKRHTPVLVCLWHNRILGSVLAEYHEHGGTTRPVPLSVLTSASKDGGLLAAFVRHFRMGHVRGSSSRRGATALLEIQSHLTGGSDIAITPDGPRGPCYHLAPGILYLAQRTGTPIVPLLVEVSSFWKVGKRWDAFRIPKPFAKVTTRYLAPLTIPPGDDAAFEIELQKLAKIMGAD